MDKEYNKRLAVVKAHLVPEQKDKEKEERDFWRFSKTALNGSVALDKIRQRMHELSKGVLDDERSAIFHITQKDDKQRHAGILVPLFEENGEIRFLLTERSANLRSHGGDVCFPGGKTDEGEDDLDAAVREAEEEIGLTTNQLEVIGFLPGMRSRCKCLYVVV